MIQFLTLIFWTVLAFSASDYTLGRLTVKDPLRAIVAGIFAVLFVLIVKPGGILS